MRKKVKRDRKTRRKRRVQLLRKIKCGIGCQFEYPDGSVCGYNEEGVALDFAHVNNADKHPMAWKHRSGAGMNNLYTRISIRDQDKNRMYIRELIEEVRKCKILCKNHHAIETEQNKEFERNFEITQNRKYESWKGTKGDQGEKVAKLEMKASSKEPTLEHRFG